MTCNAMLWWRQLVDMLPLATFRDLLCQFRLTQRARDYCDIVSSWCANKVILGSLCFVDLHIDQFFFRYSFYFYRCLFETTGTLLPSVRFLKQLVVCAHRLGAVDSQAVPLIKQARKDFMRFTFLSQSCTVFVSPLRSGCLCGWCKTRDNFLCLLSGSQYNCQWAQCHVRKSVTGW